MFKGEETKNSNPRGLILDNYVEVDMDEEWTITNEGLFTKCAWTPFEGLKVKGKVIKTVLRGKTVFDQGQIIGKASGEVIFPR